MSRRGGKGKGRGRKGAGPDPDQGPARQGRRRRSVEQAAEAASAPPSPRGPRGRLLPAGAALAGLAVLAAGVWLAMGRRGEPTPFPPPAATFATAPSLDSFVGAERCAGCHQERYDAWEGSTHGRAGGLPSPDLVIAPFDGTPIVFRDGRVIPTVADDGTYRFVVRQDGHPEAVYEVDGVIGRGHMVGGGTQGFTARHVDGTVRFLPFDWSRHRQAWFCNTGTRLDQGWVVVTPELSLADCGDWPPLRVLGTVDRFGNCQGCHGSQIVTDQPAGEGYRTRFTTLQVNCESCHGPGLEHVEMAEAGRLGLDAGTGLLPLGTVDVNGSLDTCFQCHALKDVVREGHLPGPELADYYALKFPLLGDDPFFADFRVKTFAYQATHLSSACYLDGAMTCVSCHDPHGQGYQDEFGVAMPGRFDDAQCTSCHASKGLDPRAHTFHPPASEGARCVSCHMPYLQQPEVGPDVPYGRSDHTIPVPRPAFDAGLGLEGACVQCHQDRTLDELGVQATAWWGDLKPHRPLIQALADQTPADREAAARVLLRPDQDDPLAQFAALGRFVGAYLEPDAGDLSAEVVDALEALAHGPDLEVRALALAALHWARGGDRRTRRLLADALSPPSPESDRLRRRWVLALSFLGDQARTRGDAARALAAYGKALELLPEDARLLGVMGAALNQAGAFDRALVYLRRSAAADSSRALTRVNEGIALAALGDRQGAIDAYATAVRVRPVEPLAFFNLGNLYLREGSLREATAAYRRAVTLEPGLARGHFNLARALIQQRRLVEALPHARRALELEPDHENARQMVRDLEAAVLRTPP